MNYLSSLLCLIFILTDPLFCQIIRSSDITTDELLEHVKYLSSDKLEGRRIGTLGADLSAEYISNEFKVYGLAPKGDSCMYYQKFDFISGIKLGTENQLQIIINDVGNELYTPKGESTTILNSKIDLDYRPLGFSSSGVFVGQVIFAGYGISNSENNYDDYNGLDVKDKAVMVLRYAPPRDSMQGDYEQYSSLRYKAAKAKELGAKMLIVVTGPIDTDKDELMRLTYDQTTGNCGIIAINITQAIADTILKNVQTTIKKCQEQINKSKSPKSFTVDGISLSTKVDLQELHAMGVNVIGYLEGSDEILKNEVIIIGAHYDHLGYGGEGSGSLKPDTIAIHHGADDNASGTSGLLELAQAMSYQQKGLKRSILFISFTGEEIGLLGSGYYVKHPSIPLEKCITMLNLDMIGRLNNQALIIFGTGTSSSFDSLVQTHNRDSIFTLKLNKDGYGPSDNSSFYSKKIPILFFFTDLHQDYHRPTDTYEKLNYKGLQQVVRYIESIILDIDKMPKPPKYVAVDSQKPSNYNRQNIRVYVGTIPDFSEHTEGYKISGVREGSPAAKAGLQGGDVIVKFGKVEIKNIQDYTYAINEYKAGDIVIVLIKRRTEIHTMKVVLESKK